MPAQIRHLQNPASYTINVIPENILNNERGVWKLNEDKFGASDLVGAHIEDTQIEKSRNQRIARLNKLVNVGALDQPFDVHRIITKICENERWKSIHTVFNLLSDAHLYSKHLMDRLVE